MRDYKEATDIMLQTIKTHVLFSFLSLSLGFGINLSQQPNAAANESSGGVVYYTVGTQWLNTNPLNQSLKKAGYSQSESLFWGQGFGLNGMYQKFLVGLEFQSLFGQTLLKEQDALGVSANYSMVQLGYLLVATPRFQLYPYLGTGLGQIELYSTESLSNILPASQGSNPYMGQIQSQSWLLDFGLGSQVIIPMSPTNTSDSRGLTLGLKAGYIWQPLASVWQHNQLPMQGPDKINIDGFYLRFQAGFGGYK